MENTVNRRETLKSLMLLTGAAFTVGSSAAFLSGCKADTSTDWTPGAISADQMTLLEKLTERILPKTDTPGANDALVHRYIDEALKNNYTADDKKRFLADLTKIEDLCREKYKSKFNALSDDKVDDILTILAEEWKKTKDGKHIFKELRDLTISGYTTSEVGAKQFLVYDPLPGPYQGCIDYSKVGGTYALG